MDIPTLQSLMSYPSYLIDTKDPNCTFFSLTNDQYKILGVFEFGCVVELIELGSGFTFSIKISHGIKHKYKIVEVEISGSNGPCRFTVIGNHGKRTDSGWIDANKTKSKIIKMCDLFPLLKDSDAVIYKKALVVFVEFQKPPPRSNGLMHLPWPIVKSQDYVNPIWKKLFETKEVSDLEIHVISENGIQQIKTHRAILVASSEVFKTMLQTDTSENSRSVIEITDFKPEVIDELLEFLYLGHVDLETNPIDLFKCADKYNIRDLLEKCEAYIIESLGKNSMDWTTLFEMVKLYGDRFEDLKDAVKAYFQLNLEELMKDEGLRNAHKLYPDVYEDLFCDTT